MVPTPHCLNRLKKGAGTTLLLFITTPSALHHHALSPFMGRGIRLPSPTAWERGWG